MRFRGKLLLVVAFVVGSSMLVRSQVTTATLYGIVEDPGGAVIPGAKVTLIHQGTNAARETVSGETGEFAFTALPVGLYMLRIEKPGFKSYVNTGVELDAAQSVRQTHALQVGEVAETVTVEGTAPLVNTVSSEQRESLNALQVTELPLSRRNVTNVLRLSSGVDIGGGSVRINGQGK